MIDSCCMSVIPPYIKEKLLTYYSALQPPGGAGASTILPSDDSPVDLLQSQQITPSTFTSLWNRIFSPSSSHIEIWDNNGLSDISQAKLILSRNDKGTASFNKAAVQAQVCFNHMEKIDRFFRDEFHTPPVKTATQGMLGYIHTEEAFNNAFWHPQSERIYFGDVDPAIFKPLVYNPCHYPHF